ncbi:hypothetical protein CXB51_018262 [Gossypium anomalum]|uniref:RRM domain-containing protein n=1 Tax=Gossypium anomalum TaxID=47600 RepID=A0A8J6D1M2_9ROSI|nr:hypothetical protein CXB51_018262 [Gossypium anomalum]
MGSRVVYNWILEKSRRHWSQQASLADFDRRRVCVGKLSFSLAEACGNEMAEALATAGMSRPCMFKAWCMRLLLGMVSLLKVFAFVNVYGTCDFVIPLLSQKKKKKSGERRIVETIFVYNIPNSMHWKGLWALFRYHCDVVDAFIPSKRCRNGKRFGFVRFSNERDTLRAIMRLNGFLLLGKRIGPWSEKLKLKERVSWIEVSGVPLHCWNYETCKRVAGLWGKLVPVGKNLTKVHNFKKIELLIFISQTNMIDEVVSLEVGDIIFSIKVRERGLSELKKDNFISKYSWKKKEEVSISEAGSVVNSRPKIQSGGIKSGKTGALMVANLENGKKSNECQNMMEVDNEEVENAETFIPDDLIGPEEERKKMDRVKLKEKERKSRKEDERIVNLSLLDLDISNRMKVILKEVNNT